VVRCAKGIWPSEDPLQQLDAVGSSWRSAIGSSAPTRMGVFARIMEGLAIEATVPKTVMIHATYIKAHPQGFGPWVGKRGANQRRYEHQIACCH
jgi:hypothetical protein